jgi:hypothetical protein
MHPFLEKMIRQVQMTPPRCLAGFRARPSRSSTWNHEVGWSLACPCGATTGEVCGHPLKNLFVSPLGFGCSSCGKATEILDTKQHGYNAEVAKAQGTNWDSNAHGTGEKQAIPCPGCGENKFAVMTFFGHNNFDLVEDCPDLQATAQDYFRCEGKCAACGNTSKLVGFELA